VKIGIFGENSYIGTMFGLSCREEAGLIDRHEISYINSINTEWKNLSFKSYDVVLHVAGIAHVSADPKLEAQYYAINRDLPIQVAQKAKAEGVKQFIFLSSMIVYGDDTHLGETFTITADTKPKPGNFYARSKFEAEIGLQAFVDEKFSVSIIRTPMVYGQGCKGNFPKLVSMAKKIPIFPDLNNHRSMIYIDNLCAYLKLVIDNKITGVLFPQNTEDVSTKDIISHTARITNHKVFFTIFFNPFLLLLSKKVGLLRKLFGSKVYDKSLSLDMQSYNLYTFEQSMERYFKL